MNYMLSPMPHLLSCFCAVVLLQSVRGNRLTHCTAGAKIEKRICIKMKSMHSNGYQMDKLYHACYVCVLNVWSIRYGVLCDVFYTSSTVRVLQGRWLERGMPVYNYLSRCYGAN